MRYGLLFSRFLVPERCGLNWKDELSVLAPDVPLERGGKFVEILSGESVFRLLPDARLRVLRKGNEMTLYADELICGDEILFDRRDCLWNLKELEAHEQTISTPPAI